MGLTHQVHSSALCGCGNLQSKQIDLSFVSEDPSIHFTPGIQKENIVNSILSNILFRLC